MHGVSQLDVSIVMPCLNEADTLGSCLTKALRFMHENNIAGEIIVADNGSVDGSLEIAAAHGVRVVKVVARGYGNALMAGIAEAKGKYVVMGDADDSYDFGEIPRFLNKLKEGYDFVQGCRLSIGGGTIKPGAMPLLHRWLGNPAFSFMAKHMFQAPIHDVYCGLRAFNKKAYESLNQRCTGMEFATEMIIKASLRNLKIAEVPITLHPDGRKQHAPHLKTFRDGWRTLRFFLICSPRWLFLIPGLALFLLGLAGYSLALPGFTIGGVAFDAHTLLVASMALIVGQQAIFFAIFAKMFSIGEGLLPPNRSMDRFFSVFTLEKGLAISSATIVVGICMLFFAVNIWRLNNFGSLDYSHTMRLVVPGTTLIVLGAQTIFSSFIISILGIRKK